MLQTMNLEHYLFVFQVASESHWTPNGVSLWTAVRRVKKLRKEGCSFKYVFKKLLFLLHSRTLHFA